VDASPRTGRDAPTPRVLLCCGVDYTPTLRVSADLLDLAAAPSRGPLLWVTGREVSSRPDLPPSPAQHTGSGRGQDPTCSRHPKTKGTCPGPGGLCLLEESAGSFREVQQTWVLPAPPACNMLGWQNEGGRPRLRPTLPRPGRVREGVRTQPWRRELPAGEEHGHRLFIPWLPIRAAQAPIVGCVVSRTTGGSPLAVWGRFGAPSRPRRDVDHTLLWYRSRG
jgi:hypothetical protein